MDEVFLDRVMGEFEGVGKVDDFVGTMWRGWRNVRDESKGIVQVSRLIAYISDACADEKKLSPFNLASFARIICYTHPGQTQLYH
jgi:hypothetical protein